MTGLSARTGFTAPSVDEIRAGLVARLQGIHGVGTVLDADQEDGKAATAFAEAAHDLWQLGEDIYAAADPNEALGQALFRLGAFCGIVWKAGAFGEVPLQVRVRSGETLLAGSLAEDVRTGVKYATAADVPSDDDNVWRNVTGVAATYGTAKSLAGGVTKIVREAYEFLEVRNITDGVGGTAQETQAQFRVRRAASVAGPSQGMTDGLACELMKIPGVGRVKIRENVSSAWANVHGTDAALPPKSIAVLVEYGIEPAVSQAIYKRMGQAITLVGSTLQHVTDAAGVPQPIRYTEVSGNPTALVLAISYRELPGQGFGGEEGEAAVKTAVSDWVKTNVDIGGTLNLFNLAPVITGAVQGTGGGNAIEIVDLQLGVPRGGMAGPSVDVPWDHFASLDEADITMTAV
jgi:hypothetical protein